MSNEFSASRRRLLIASAAMAASRVMPAYAQEDETLRVGEGTVPDYTHFYVADKMGLWRQNKLAVTPTMFPAGRLAVDALVAGKVDLAMSAETPVMFAAVNGLPVQVIATVVKYQPFDLIAGPKIRDLNDLRGKRIAYVQGTNVHYYLDALVRSRGLTWQDIAAINMPAGDIVPSLVSGAVDGFVWSEPLVSLALNHGPQFHRLHSEGLYFTYGCVSALRETVKQRPEALARALKALVAADKIIKTEVPQAQNILSETLKIEPAATAALWPTLNFKVGLDRQPLIHVLEQQTQWAMASKLTRPGATVPDYAAIVTEDICRKAGIV